MRHIIVIVMINIVLIVVVMIMVMIMITSFMQILMSLAMWGEIPGEMESRKPSVAI